MNKSVYTCLFFFFLTGCNLNDFSKKSPDEAPSNLYINPGDILVSSTVADDLMLIRPNGSDAKFITSVDRTTNRVVGTGYMHTSDEVLIVIEGQDKIMAMNPINGKIRDFIINVNLTGTLRNAIQLLDGHILVIETNNIEKFTEQGLRIATGGWPLTVTGAQRVNPTRDGGFMVCAAGVTDRIRLYDADGTMITEDAGPTAHDATGCAQMSDGRIVVAWSGASDQVWIYDEDLTNGEKIIDNADLALMPAPVGLAITKDQKIIIGDFTFHHLLMFEADGTFVKTFGVLHDIVDLFVVPK